MKETLRILDDKSVESSLGWRIDILSIDSFQYVEEGRAIKLEIEDRPDARGELAWIIYLPANWIWEKTNNDEPVTPEKIHEILNRISLAFWKLDMKIKKIV
jgi:hypothetical protein